MMSPTELSSSNHRRISALVVCVIAALCGLHATSARASARFTYEMCDSAIPGGNPPLIDFHANPGVAYVPFQSCAVGNGAVGVEQTGTVTSNPAWIETGVPATPGGWVESLTITAFALDFHGNGGHVDEEGWPLPGADDTPRYFFLTSTPPSPLAEAFGEGGAAFDVTLTCSGTCEPGAEIGAHYLAAVEVDQNAPTVKKIEGPLVGGTVLRGHQTLSAEAADEGGGVSSMELKVNGVTMPGTVAGACSVVSVDNPSYTGVAATSPTPCPPTLSGSWDVDTSAAPFENGTNTVQVCASDFATTGSPNITCSKPQTVEVNNTCTESAVNGGQQLSAGFSKSGSDEITVGFGHAAEVTGSLTDQAGDPIPGATVCVQSEDEGSTAPPTTVATATTDSHGDFTYEVPAGPNRQLLLGYRHDSFQISKPLSIGTHARPTLELSRRKVRNGSPIKITGRLPNPNPGGHVLVLQGASVHGRHWLTFRKVTTGLKGRYKATYRFTRTPSKETYRLRAVVPHQAGYDYDAGVSKAERVTVHP